MKSGVPTHAASRRLQTPPLPVSQPTQPNATASPTEPASAEASAEAEAPTEVEVVQLGTFGANEFEEALLTMMPRFQE